MGVPTNDKSALYYWAAHSRPVLKEDGGLAELVLTGGCLPYMVHKNEWARPDE